MKTHRANFLGMIGLAVSLVALQIGCQQTEEASSTESSSPTTYGSPGQPEKNNLAGQSASSAGNRATAPSPAPARAVTLAADTPLKVRTTNTLSTDSHNAGDTFVAMLEEPLVAGGREIASKGSTVEGRIVEADKGGRVSGVSHLTLSLNQLHTTSGEIVEISTNPITVQADTTKGKDAAKIGIGAGIGTAIGAIAGGKKGAAIGAATGAGAGTGVVLSTRGDAAEIPGETVLTFGLRLPVTITERR
ncbi:MAG: hypothetical protein HY313_04225 [Acidobacteria bacterium]|nr:hypothetical protein [Acidobacteriota bacterium]